MMARQRQTKMDCSSHTTVMVGTGVVEVQENMWIRELGLYSTDRETLLSPTGWLTDNIINAAQGLLKKNPHVVSGLQNVSLGLTMNFDVEPGEFVQILNNGLGHWLTISTIGTPHPEVQVYDSVYMFASQRTIAQTAALLHTNHSAMTFSFMDTQKQCGQCDCGLFAISFATALVFGKHF